MLQSLVRWSAIVGCSVALSAQAPPVQLIGMARLPADTFVGGQPSGEFQPSGVRGGRFGAQPVQGLSSIRPDPNSGGAWLVLCDNGYGTRQNSPDFFLRIYRARPSWRNSRGGDGNVDVGSPIQLADPDRRVPFHLVRDDTPERWLTGADFDPESLAMAPDGTLWIGDEFGPFLLHVAADGRLIAPPFEASGYRSPDHPQVAAPEAGQLSAATVRRSRGFEGLAVSADGTRLFALLESPTLADAPDTTRILEFDPIRGRFTGRSWKYRLDAPGQAVTELVAYAPGRFVVIERDSGHGPDARFKRVFAIVLGQPESHVEKTLVADLMGIADPSNLAGLGPAFTFPFVTTEAVWPEDGQTLVIVNDNNFPATGGRQKDVRDATEFIRLRLPQPLPR